MELNEKNEDSIEIKISFLGKIKINKHIFKKHFKL